MEFAGLEDMQLNGKLKAMKSTNNWNGLTLLFVKEVRLNHAEK